MPSDAEDRTPPVTMDWTPEGVKSAVTEQLNAVTSSVSAIVDQGLASTSDAVRSGTAAVSSGAHTVKAHTKGLLSEVDHLIRQGEKVAVEHIREGVAIASEHQLESTAIGVAAALILVPGARRFVFRQTLGRLRSEEAAFKSAELRGAAVRERIEGQGGEIKKLQERLGLAQAEYSRGLSKLQATVGELEALSGRITKEERAAADLLAELRRMPSKQAIAMRSEVAKQAAAAKAQRKSVDRLVLDLAKQGI